MQRRKTTHEFRLGDGVKLKLVYGPRGELDSAVLMRDSALYGCVILHRRAVGRLVKVLRQEIHHDG